MRTSTIVAVAAATLAALSVGAARADILIGLATPITGPYAWAGEQVSQGAQMAIRHLNERGGVLGESLEALVVDDFCDPEQAVAAAQKLVDASVPLVIGHQCSGAAIPASEIYEAADIVLISPAATNPRLTERGLQSFFRVCGRDDQQGAMAANVLAEKWGEGNIAIIHDGQAYGQGVAEETKRWLNELGVQEVLFEAVTPGQTDFPDLISRMEKAGVDAAFFGGYQAEGALIIRQAGERMPDTSFVVPDGVLGEDFWLIAGDAAEGTLMTSHPEVRDRPELAPLVEEFRADGFEPISATLYAYAAVQSWAQAVEKAESLDLDDVIGSLRNHKFDTVLGTIGFDEKGDVTGTESFAWYKWTNGEYVPADFD